MRTRISALCLPISPSRCPRVECVYNSFGVCDEPRICKGNGDAACHQMSNRDLLKLLTDAARDFPSEPPRRTDDDHKDG